MTLLDRIVSAFVPHERALTPNQIFGRDVWEDLQGTAGERVDQKTAMTLSAVWSAVRLLSQDVATLPFHAIEVRGTERIPVDPQPDWLSNPQVSDENFTSVDYLSQLCVSLLIDGNAFVLTLPNVQRPFELTVLNPQRVDVKRENGAVTYAIRDDLNNIIRDGMTAAQILHIPWVRRPGELRGLSPVQVQEETIGRGLAAQEISARFFRQGHVFGGIIEVPRDTDASKEEVRAMLAELNKRHGGHKKAWIPGALTGGAQFKETTMKPADSQLLETERWIREQIGSAYGIPPFLMGSLEPGAVSYASTEQQGILYKQSAVRPISTRIERAHTRLLRPGQQMKFNLDGLLRADFKTRTEGYRELWNIGVLNANEIRAREDLAPIDSEIGTTHWVPLNMGPAETVKNMPLNDPPGPRPAPSEDGSRSLSMTVNPAVYFPEGFIHHESHHTINTPEVQVQPADVRVEVPVTVEPSSPPEVHVDVQPPNVTVVMPPQDEKEKPANG